MQFMDSFNSIKFYSKNLRKVLKELADQSPKETNFQELVRIGYENLVATTTVFSGLNPLTGATGTTRAATPADFGFPVVPGPIFFFWKVSSFWLQEEESWRIWNIQTTGWRWTGGTRRRAGGHSVWKYWWTGWLSWNNKETQSATEEVGHPMLLWKVWFQNTC